jgi:hypothetical protein
MLAEDEEELGLNNNNFNVGLKNNNHSAFIT